MLETSGQFFIESITRLLALRDIETADHTERVAKLFVKLARKSGDFTEAEIQAGYYGALLHDIGKLGIPDSVLKKPGRLNEAEFKLMQTHPIHAYEWLQATPGFESLLDIPYCHHEKWDGTGYPRGLKGKEIPLAARLFAVIDVWDALTTDRCYRPAWSEDQAYHYILSHAGIYFDPYMVELFAQNFHPSGIQIDMRKLTLHPALI